MHVKQNVSLSCRTTFRLGGNAALFFEATSEDEVSEAHRWAQKEGVSLFILGGGSNVVVADEGVDGLVVRPALKGIAVDRDGDHVRVTVGAGEVWQDFVAQAVAEGWSGVEALAGIPGLVGATPIQNVGAYGQEVSDTLAQVRVLDRHGGAMATLARDACGLSYRSSRFKEDPSGYVVTAVQFRFPVDPLGAPVRYAELAKALGVPLGTRVPAATVLETVLALRKSKGMIWEADEACPGSAGSFFTNPIVTTAEAAAVEERARQEGHLPPGETMPRFPASEGRQKLAAAWLVERAGFSKGTRRGSVGVSARHALSLVHYGGGTAAELVALAREVRDGVRERFGVVLVPEPVFLGMVWA